MKYGVAFQTAFTSMGGTTEVIEFDSEQAARDFITEMQPAAGVVLAFVQFAYASYEVIE
ncbi:hypothetical protein [Mycolicibacterium fortuitum]|uniref:hypothetical protein n=1 Tax=Mycolicibacterium fortuitum TaxID=1766 RepID=UPI00260910B4|nr:hypothetical protein [Mycolicibacterium fortuitum]